MSSWQDQFPTEAVAFHRMVSFLAWEIVAQLDRHRASNGWYKFDAVKLRDNELREVAKDKILEALSENPYLTAIQAVFLAKGRMAQGAREYRKLHQNGPLNPPKRKPAQHWQGQRREGLQFTWEEYRELLFNQIVEEGAVMQELKLAKQNGNEYHAMVIEEYAKRVEKAQADTAAALGMSTRTFKRHLADARRYFIPRLEDAGIMPRTPAA